jgi:L-2-hydroxyglutarate oxidase LhgO
MILLKQHPGYIRTSVEPDKAAIIGDRDGLGEAGLAALGLRIEQAERFYAEVRRYWPDLPDGALQPAYSGVRPKLYGPGQTAPDFRVDGPLDHGIEGLVNLLGIESPGLTSSLAIAEHVAGLLQA